MALFLLVHRGAYFSVQVVAPAPKSPADRGGVTPGDVLLEIDGVPTENESLYTIGDKLQGDRGTEVLY